MSGGSTVSASTILSSAIPSHFKTSAVEKPDDLEYDIGNLSAFDVSPLDSNKLKSSEYLNEIGRENLQLFMNRIFSLPSEPIPGESGRLIDLTTGGSLLPRSKPLPKPKAPTKWETFAATKGITKTKKSRMTYDEEKGGYAPRWGYGRANNESENVIIEHREGDDPSIDPWNRLKSEKRARVETNKKQQQRNLNAATGSRVPGTIDLSSAFPNKEKKTHSLKKREQSEAQKPKSDHHVDLALKVAQRSTASMGKFDTARKGEKRVQFSAGDSVPSSVDVKAEKARSLNLLNKMLGKTESDGEKINLHKAAAVGQQSKEIKNIRNKQNDAGGKKRKRT